MGLDELFEKRRSIRAYKEGTVVEREQIEGLIKAAVEAPSWKNSQTGRYYVAMTPEIVEKIKMTCLPEFNAKSSKAAPVLIVTTFVKNRAGFNREGNPDNELGNEWGAYDLGLQNENLVLKAAELGLDTLIMGIRDGEKLRELLEIPQEEEVAAVISVGYRTDDPVKPRRREVGQIAKFY